LLNENILKKISQYHFSIDNVCAPQNHFPKPRILFNKRL